VDLGYPEIQGELTDVACYGAKYAAKKLGKPVIVEDAGLFIKALEWFPGTYSSYVQSTLGNEGILKLMKNVHDRYAEFRSVIGFAGAKKANHKKENTYLHMILFSNHNRVI
jgi:XTP/dITP diphosphohydrolase